MARPNSFERAFHSKLRGRPSVAEDIETARPDFPGHLGIADRDARPEVTAGMVWIVLRNRENNKAMRVLGIINR